MPGVVWRAQRGKARAAFATAGQPAAVVGKHQPTVLLVVVAQLQQPGAAGGVVQ
jgi:hypothetical protein